MKFINVSVQQKALVFVQGQLAGSGLAHRL
jgi:hypothetical protein